MESRFRIFEREAHGIRLVFGREAFIRFDDVGPANRGPGWTEPIRYEDYWKEVYREQWPIDVTLDWIFSGRFDEAMKKATPQ